MKRYLVIPLMFLYLLAVTGIVVNAHYCGKNLVSWNVFLKANPCGGCDDDQGKVVSHKCCKDKQVNAKVTHDQNSVSINLQLDAAIHLPADQPQIVFGEMDVPATSEIAFTHRANAPPGLWQNIPLYKLHSRFTYYG